MVLIKLDDKLFFYVVLSYSSRNGKGGVPRRAQRGQKPRVEQKGKSSLDLDFQ